eukprot:CAMPEP_0180670526 /NCGR_PEP_ID=MMETSP1037_2-20121125/64078_1 /TAXON_ID=632150 /ORGANISM="Azadinium spinosum, Strain 3D9" /LENGTH=120 /DNA_ID=CAMNT_0022699473 /DNA_START=268 /DNA_END=627 /DNA_ORIENTATION=-
MKARIRALQYRAHALHKNHARASNAADVIQHADTAALSTEHTIQHWQGDTFNGGHIDMVPGNGDTGIWPLRTCDRLAKRPVQGIELVSHLLTTIVQLRRKEAIHTERRWPGDGASAQLLL